MTIVVGVDGSREAQHALRWAVAEGKLRGTLVRAVYAWEPAAALGASDALLGGSAFGAAIPEGGGLQRSSEDLLAEALARVPDTDSVERCTVQGHSVEVLVEQARSADLLVVGSRGHGKLAGALLGSVSHACVQHASCPVVIVRAPSGAEVVDWHPDEVIARERARNTETWISLQRLGVVEGSELRLDFVYDSGGAIGDRELAEFLRRETDYEVEVEAGGVTGSTAPMAVSPAALDEWVAWMVQVGHDNGGCAFDGWTATVTSGS